MLRIKNTFLDIAPDRSPSLAPFFRERVVRSCPSSPATRQSEELGFFTTAWSASTTDSRTRSSSPSSSADQYQATRSSSPSSTGGDRVVGTKSTTSVYSAETVDTTSQGAELPLTWSAAVPTALISVSSPLPNPGSVGHHLGECDPCAFFNSGRCDKGERCTFCHLCDPEERKRRRKEKVEKKRQARRMAKGVVGRR